MTNEYGERVFQFKIGDRVLYEDYPAVILAYDAPGTIWDYVIEVFNPNYSEDSDIRIQLVSENELELESTE